MGETAYIKRIQLEHIRAFKTLDIDLDVPGGQRMTSVIIGRNGTCKSTLLRCIALALCDESDSAALLAKSGWGITTEGVNRGSIQLTMANPSGKELGTIRLVLESQNGRDRIVERKTTVPNTDFFVCGYGPYRGNTGPISSSTILSYRIFDSVATLFDYQANLLDTELTLRRLADDLGNVSYSQAQRGIKQVLGLDETHSIDYGRDRWGVFVSGPGIGKDIPIQAWADGYRLTYTWLIDLYGQAIMAKKVMANGGIAGILLVDEIDQNLHPTMQSSLLSHLQNALPEMQIFVTTHSPLTALGTDSKNIVSLQRQNGGIFMKTVPQLTAYSADDVLSEESMFDVTPYSQDTSRKMERLHFLSAISPANRNVSQKSEMKKLTKELDPEELPILRDDPVLKKLDQIATLLEKNNPS